MAAIAPMDRMTTVTASGPYATECRGVEMVAGTAIAPSARMLHATTRHVSVCSSRAARNEVSHW